VVPGGGVKGTSLGARRVDERGKRLEDEATLVEE
jgi:hypothetical protein